MRKFGIGRAAAITLAGFLCAAGPQMASAATFQISSAQLDTSVGYLQGLLVSPALGGSEWGGIGRLSLTGTDENGADVSFETFCADISAPLSAGIFTEATPSVLPFSASKISAVTAFLANATPLVVSARTSAAAQLGVWEILNENDGTPYDITSGAFSVESADSDLSAAMTLANGWLANVADDSWTAGANTTLAVLDPIGRNQAQIFAIKAGGSAPQLSAVPEPSSWALMLGGFGFLGATLRRRRPARAIA